MSAWHPIYYDKDHNVIEAEIPRNGKTILVKYYNGEWEPQDDEESTWKFVVKDYTVHYTTAFVLWWEDYPISATNPYELYSCDFSESGERVAYQGDQSFIELIAWCYPGELDYEKNEHSSCNCGAQ